MKPGGLNKNSRVLYAKPGGLNKKKQMVSICKTVWKTEWRYSGGNHMEIAVKSHFTKTWRIIYGHI